MGRSGKAALSLLQAGGLQLRVYDQKLDPAWAQSLAGAGVTSFSGPSVPEAAFEGIDLLVLSPGVDPRPIRAQLATLAPKARVEGEMSLALGVAQALWPQVKTVLVTGTNGKSTVTDMTAALLRAQIEGVFAGGNLGKPLSELVLEVQQGLEARPQALVLECSSYQLESMEHFRSDVSMLLNLSPDHLARYRDMEDYARTKARVFSGLGAEGLALLDHEDSRSEELRPRFETKVIMIASPEGPRMIASAADAEHPETLCFGESGRISRNEVPLPGRHNAKNALFAVSAALFLGVDFEAARAALLDYPGLPHRMRWVAEHAGITYINDSKATNMASVVAGLTGFERPVVLLLGGMSKEGDNPAPLRDLLQKHGRAVVAYGRDAQHFVDLIEDIVPTYAVDDLAQAFAAARRVALAGDVILLSPAAASWDQYASFEKRGEHFEALVAALDSGVQPSIEFRTKR